MKSYRKTGFNIISAFGTESVALYDPEKGQLDARDLHSVNV